MLSHDASIVAAAFAEYAQFRAISDFSARKWVTIAMSSLYKNVGPDAVEEVLMDFFGPMYADSAAAYWEMSFHDRVLSNINNIRNCLDASAIIVAEDEEKLSFRMTPCVTGEKLYKDGIYEGDRPCSMCAPHRITGGEDQFPIYCTHNPAIDMACINACGYPNSVTEFSEKMCSCSCTYVVYRRKEDIPEKYFTRLGKKKPV